MATEFDVNNLIINGNKPENVVVNINGEEKQVDTVIFAQSPNLIPFPYAFQGSYPNSPFTISGVTFTVNEDGSITINGTNETSSTISLVVISSSTKLQVTSGNYLVYGVTEGSYTTYGLNCSLFKGTTSTDYYYRYKNVYNDNNPIGTDGAPRLANVTDNTVRLAVNLVVRANATLDNVIVKPMFVKSDKLLPFKKYNREVVYYKHTGQTPGKLGEEVVDDTTVLSDESMEEENFV